RRLIEKRPLLDAGHPLFGVLFGNDGFELVGLNLNGPVVLGYVAPGLAAGQLGQKRASAGNCNEQRTPWKRDLKRLGNSHGLLSKGQGPNGLADTHLASRMIRPYTSRAASICSCACWRTLSVGKRLLVRSRVSSWS